MLTKDMIFFFTFHQLKGELILYQRKSTYVENSMFNQRKYFLHNFIETLFHITDV